MTNFTPAQKRRLKRVWRKFDRETPAGHVALVHAVVNRNARLRDVIDAEAKGEMTVLVIEEGIDCDGTRCHSVGETRATVGHVKRLVDDILASAEGPTTVWIANPRAHIPCLLDPLIEPVAAFMEAS